MLKLRSALPILVISSLLAAPLFAKRAAPKPVEPVARNGIQYSAPNKDGRNAYVIATDQKTGKILWKVKVFHTSIKPYLEEDVQWVFITKLQLSGNSLLVRDEKFRCYRIDLSTRAVKGGHWFSCW